MSLSIRVLKNTIFKQSSVPANQLSESEKIDIEQGKSFPISAFIPAENQHIKFTFCLDEEGNQIALRPNGSAPKNTWFAFGSHIQIVDGSKVVFPLSKEPRLIMKPTGRRHKECCEFTLALEREERIVDTVRIISGGPHKSAVYPTQDFRRSCRPIPEGVYWVGAVDRGSFGDAIGKVWISLTVKNSYMANDRGDFGIHQDFNYSISPGSAGCVCPITMAETEKVACWVEENQVRELVVDHGFGFLHDRGWEG